MTKLMCQLNSFTYICDYEELVDGLVVGNDEISSRHCLSLSFDQMEDLTSSFDVYVLMNLLYSQHELDVVRKWLEMIKSSHIKGIIFQDFGLWMMAKELGLPQEMMYGPETLNTKHMTLNDLCDLGIDSAFLAREISKEDIMNILENSHMPIMVQVHGVQYMGHSKRPLLSNFNANIQGNLSNGPYTLKVKDSPIEAYIYEDCHGCHVQTKEEMCALELLHHFKKAEWFYLETKYMDEYRALEMANLYHEAVNSINNNTYLKVVHEIKPLMSRLMKGVMNTGFMEDGTVYRLEDVREKDNEKRN